MIDQQLRHPCRLRDAQVGALEKGSEQALGRNRILVGELCTGPQRDNNSTATTGDLSWNLRSRARCPGAHFLEDRRNSEERIDLAFRKQLHRLHV